MARDDDPKDDELARALRAATSAGRVELDPLELDALVAGALEAADVTPEEARAAEALRAELDAGTNELANALRAAAASTELPAETHAALVAAALRRPMPVTAARSGGASIRRLVYGTASTLALAAAVLLAVRVREPAPLGAQLVPARSTQELFDAPFTGEATTARIDRIALARAGDFRANRFASWGVR